MNVEEVVALYALSPMQQGMLFHSLQAPQSGVYLQQLVCALHENLCVPAFKQAWQHLMARHPILRTRFRWEGTNAPVQEVCRQVPLPWVEHDWRHMTVEEQAHQLETYLQADRQRGFQGTEAPLIRLALFWVAEADYRFVWTSHHALLDGRSRLVLLQELFAVYEALCRRQDLQLASPPLYQEYIAWLEAQDWTTAETFWRHRLRGFRAPTPVAGRADQATAGAQSHGKQSLRLAEELTAGLQDLAQQYHLTLNTLLQGAWALLLSRYSGELDVVFGATRAGRQSALPGAASMVGLLINTLPVRVHIAPEKALLPWLQDLRAQWIALREYEQTPLVQVQQWSDLPPGTPLFESLVVFENYLLDDALRAQEEVWLQREFQLLGTTHYPLTVTGYLAPALLLEITYDQQRFDAATITRLLGHLQTVLASMATTPEQRLADVPWLNDWERQQLLVAWNDTYTDYPRDQCIHQLFAEQAERTPDAVAVVGEDQRLTYRQLQQQANQLAHYLQSLGVGPETLVGLCVERSVAMIVGLLGILQAGAAYVPLDPAYPPERLAFMLADAQAPVLVTQHRLVATLPVSAAQVVCLDTDWPTITQAGDATPVSTVTAENLAYVMYTSGSTGRPKGVGITHRGVVRLAKNTNYAALTASEVFLQFAPIAFDASTFEIWGCLLNGARLVVFPAHTPTLEELGVALQQHQVTTLWLTAGLFHQMVEEQLACLGSVRQLLAGGDVLSVPHVRKVLRELSDCRLINGYGPTESTTFACCHALTDANQIGWSVPIGRPIANTQVYILDHHLQPVPVGVPGELYIGGDGLARGYLNRPELTAERFIPNPFSPQSGTRLYKTGDLARYLPDGAIEFLGRRDHQVKMRGFRIELGEIETVLAQHPMVQEAIVLAREDHPTEKRLVAYVVPKPAQSPPPRALRAFLQTRLPEYMVPAAYVWLEKFPLTPHGKVDRQSLPAPDDASYVRNGGSATPQTVVEELLAGIWAEVLGLTQVGRQENFFALGGHSLLITRVISRLRQVFQVELPVQSLFEAPTVAALAQRIDTSRRADAPPLVPVGREHALPLSFAQQRLWFLEQLEPVSSLYTISRALRLSGLLNIAALQQALNTIVHRHEALRTTFAAVDGTPVQMIVAHRKVALPVVDLSTRAPADREAEMQRYCTQESQRPFDLAADLMLRATLLRLGAEEHVLLLTLHHIAVDGWSIDILLQELSVLYNALSLGKPAVLPALPLQYADFAVWQRQWLAGEVLNKQLAYWQQQLDNAPPLLELPTDRPRPARQTFRGAQQAVVLPHTPLRSLKALSRHAGSTLFMTLLAALKVLLHRYTGQDDIVVGTAIANRTQAETEGLIGFFVNTLVLRTNLADDPTFRELLGRVREVALGAYAHQDLPFEKLVEVLHPERNLSHSPLFQVLFVLQNTPLSAFELPGLTVSPVRVDRETAKFDLTLTLVETADGVRATVEYNTDLFDAATITRLLGHFQTLLEGIVADPEQRLSALPLLPVAERQQLLVAWNNTRGGEPQGQCLHQLFEAQMEQTPEAVAVVYEGQELTYRELNRQANRLAHHLQSLGVGPEVLVGLYSERSLEMVIGLLAILKAGGAYVPLDPTYPKDRLAFMLEDARVAVLLTRERLVSELPRHQAAVVSLDSGRERLARAREENPLSTARPENLAYVIYTSGSTGKPKGVLIEHRQICNYVQGISARCGLEPGVSFAMVQPLAADSSQTVIFPALVSGGCLHVISEDRALDPQALSEYFCGAPIDILKIAPSHLAALQTASRPEQLLPRRLLILGGEASRQEWVEQLQAMARCAIFNHYGPTEATVGMLTYPVRTDQHGPRASTVPLGRPLPNTQAYVLDRHLSPVPIGVPGELHIGGHGLARGYLNRPELTAEKFIADPFSPEPGARLYKTGDVVRYLPDGNLEFLGRTDHQVKIRGFRIEPAEVESVLGQHPAVRGVVVTAREDVPGDKRLVAYVVPHPGPTPTPGELRHFLQAQLPDYMVPSAFVLLDTLPRTPHGKVDRLALPSPNQDRSEVEKHGLTSRTPVEAVLAGIWAAVLKLERVGIYDNFFELGGDSILSIQIIARANQAGLRLTTRQLFQHQTVAELAAVAGTTPAVRAEQGLVVGAVPLTPIQQRFFEQDLPDPHHYSQALLLEVQLPLKSALLEQALQQLLRHHDALRLRFLRGATGWQQINGGPDEAIPLSLVNVSALAETEQGPAIEAATAQLQASLHLAHGPLLRAALFDLGPHKPSRLLIIVHHLAIDGISWRLLLEDLWTAYTQLSRGEAIHLPPKTTSFKQWAELLVEHAQSETLQRETAYWFSQPWAQSTRLPVDSPGGANTMASARTVRVLLSPAETQALLQEVPAGYHTQINDVLLTALAHTFVQWTGTCSLLIDLEGHGREGMVEAVDLSRTVGWFTSRFPVLLELADASCLGEALQLLKEQLRRIPHRGIGYGMLRYLSGDTTIAERLRALPQPEVSFNYLGQVDQVLPVSSPFTWAEEASGLIRSLQRHRRHLLVVNGCITAGRLQLDWSYSENLHRRATIERLAQGCMTALRVLIADGQSPQARGYTPADFPETDLSQKELDELIAELDELAE